MAESGNSTYKVVIKTGSKLGAGTDASVYLILHGTNGKSTSKNNLRSKSTQFQRSTKDIIVFEDVDVGSIKEVQIGHDDNGVGSAWYLEWVAIEKGENDLYNFQCSRWLKNPLLEVTLISSRLLRSESKKQSAASELGSVIAKAFAFTGALSWKSISQDSEIEHYLAPPPAHFPPTAGRGKRKAVFIGANCGSMSALNLCPPLDSPIHDARRVATAFQRHLGFAPSDCLTLVEDDQHPELFPTFSNIAAAFGWLTHECSSSDVLVFYFCGHGAQFLDFSGGEGVLDMTDELLIPCDYAETYKVVWDDDLFQAVTKRIPKDVNLTCFFDSCHSASVMDNNDPENPCNAISFSAAQDSQVCWEVSGADNTPAESEFSKAIMQIIAVPGIMEKTYKEFYEILSENYLKIQKLPGNTHLLADPAFFAHEKYVSANLQKFLQPVVPPAY